MKVKLHPVQHKLEYFSYVVSVSAKHKEFMCDWCHDPSLLDFVTELSPEHKEKFLYFMDGLAIGIDSVQEGIRSAMKEKNNHVGG